MRNIAKYEADYLKEDFEIYQVKYRRKKILELVGNIRPDAILEIGCGMHPLYEFLDVELYEEYTLVEPGDCFYENAVKICSNNEKIHLIHNFFGANILDEVQAHYLQYKNLSHENCVRLIICASLLHELEEPEAFIQALNVISDKDTVLLLNVPNANSFHRLLAQYMNIIKNVNEMTERNYIFQQNKVYDLNSLSEVIEKNGFRIKNKETVFIKPFTHAQMMSMLKNRIIDDEVLDGLYEMSALFPEYGSEIFVECVKT